MPIMRFLIDCATLMAIISVCPNQVTGSKNQAIESKNQVGELNNRKEIIDRKREEIIDRKRKEILEMMTPNEGEASGGPYQEEANRFGAELTFYSENYVLPPRPTNTKRIRHTHEEGLDKYQDRLKNRHQNTTFFEQLRRTSKNLYRPSVQKVQNQLTTTEKMAEMVRFRRFHGEDYGLSLQLPGRLRDEKYLLYRDEESRCLGYANGRKDESDAPRLKKPPFNSTNNHLVWY